MRPLCLKAVLGLFLMDLRGFKSMPKTRRKYSETAPPRWASPPALVISRRCCGQRVDLVDWALCLWLSDVLILTGVKARQSSVKALRL